MRLPLLLSVPHAGLRVPAEVGALCVLTPEQIRHDGDEEAGAIYALADEVAGLVTTDVARAIVDMNRAPDDLGPDGVVKTHTCWSEPVYREPPSPELVARLLDAWWRPYHAALAREAPGARLGVDCHTMAGHAPPVAPDPGAERPPLCLSDAHGTCPPELFARLAGCLEEAFGLPVSRNAPFTGGYIIRAHASERPWVQLELSRAPFADPAEKRARVLTALRAFCRAA